MILIRLSALLVAILVLQSSASFAAPEVGKKYLVGVYNKPPYVIKTQEGQWEGLSVDLWEEIARKLNWSFEYQEVEPEKLISQLKSGKLDFVIAEIPVEAETEKQLDFSQPFLTSSLSIAIPFNLRPSMAQMVKSLFNENLIWILLTIFGGIFLSGILIWFVERRRNHDHFGGNKLHGFGSAIWFSAVTMTTVGYGDKTPQTFVGRFIAFIWMLAGVLIIAGYTATVVTDLDGHHIDEIKDPHVIRNWRNGVVAGGNAYHVLKEHGFNYVQFPSNEDALTALEDGKIKSVVADRLVLSYLIKQNFSEKIKMPLLRFHEYNLAFAMPDNSPLRETINVALLEITHSEQWKTRKKFWLGETDSSEL